jgi:hypothetical protein
VLTANRSLAKSVIKKLLLYEIKVMVILTQGAKSYVLDIHVNGRKKFYTTCSVNLYIGVTQRSLMIAIQPVEKLLRIKSQIPN